MPRSRRPTAPPHQMGGRRQEDSPATAPCLPRSRSCRPRSASSERNSCLPLFFWADSSSQPHLCLYYPFCEIFICVHHVYFHLVTCEDGR